MFGEGSRETDILHLNLWQIAFLFPSKIARDLQISYNITVQKKEYTYKFIYRMIWYPLIEIEKLINNYPAQNKW